MNWQTIIPFTLLGAEQSEWSPVLDDLCKAYGIQEGLDPASKMLQILAIGIKQEQLRKPITWEGPVSLPETGSQDLWFAFEKAIEGASEFKACPDTSRGSLAFHYQKDIRLRQEIHELLLRHHYWIPPELIPSLLQEAYDHPTKWKKLLPLAGPHGFWLARQHPDWKDLIPPSSKKKQWIDLPQTSRFTALVYYLYHDTEIIAPILEESWSRLGYKEQSDILHLLNDHPQAASLGLLEQCLQKGQKNIRKLAGRILAVKSSNEWQKRMKARLEDLFSYSDEEGISLSPPGKINKIWSQDGIDAKERWNKRSAGESRVFLLLSLCPLRWLENHLQLSSAEIIEELWQHEYFPTMLQAWSASVTNYSDPDWSASLMEAWVDCHHEYGEPNLQHFLAQLPEDVFETSMLTLLDRQTVMPYQGMLLFQLMQHGTHQWNNKITTLFFQRLGLWLQHKRPHLIYPQAQQFFRIAALKCPAPLATYFKDRFPRHSKPWPNFGHMIDEFIEFMLQRQEIHEAITPTKD